MKHISASQTRGALYIGISKTYHTESLNSQSFTRRYGIKRLVYVEQTNNIKDAVRREKQLKNWHRQWKINLVESVNPGWQDLRLKYRMDAETSSA